jgi:predicted DNA-binding protein
MKKAEVNLTGPLWVRLRKEDLELLDELAKKEQRPRANMMRVLITEGLNNIRMTRDEYWMEGK